MDFAILASIAAFPVAGLLIWITIRCGAWLDSQMEDEMWKGDQ